MKRVLVLAGVLAALLLAAGPGGPFGAGSAHGARGAGSHPVAGGQRTRGQTLRIVVPLIADDAGLARFATAVSTPGSPVYRRYASLPELARRFGASPAVGRRVAGFLARAGGRAPRVSPTRMFAEATFSVAAAERAFGVRLVRRASVRGQYLAPAPAARAASGPSGPSISLPRALRGAALGVVGLDTAPLVRPAAPATESGYEPVSGTPAGCHAGVQSGGFTPNQYLSAYDFAPLRRPGMEGEGERVALIEVDGFKHSDLSAFAQCFALRVPPIRTFTVDAGHALAPGGEATLDLEVLDAAAPGLNSIEVFESGGDAAQVIDAFAAPLIAPGAKPQVLSASLGLCEPDLFASFGRGGVLAVERDLELAAATGITLLAASGDNGSSGCVDERGDPVDRLAVDYPASSPFVTAVGGTNVRLDPSNQITNQVVWNDGRVQASAGGGGRSELFRRPTYQNGLAGAARVIPDVSMLADIAPGYAIYCTARDPNCTGWTTVGGTSASAPLLAGGLAIVDQDLHRHGQEFLGALNPLLYAIGANATQRGQVFDDVTALDDDLGPFLKGSQGHPLGCCSAEPGYDRASGWGSVNLGPLDTVALSMLPSAPDIGLRLPRQHPVRRGAVQALVSCSEACRVAVFGFVLVAGARTFNLRSPPAALARAGTRRLAVRFSAAQERELRAARRQRRGIEMELFGVALDAHGRIAQVTAGRVIRIGR